MCRWGTVGPTTYPKISLIGRKIWLLLIFLCNRALFRPIYAYLPSFDSILTHIGEFYDKRSTIQHMGQYPHNSRKTLFGAKIGQKTDFSAKPLAKFSIFHKIQPYSPIAQLVRVVCKKIQYTSFCSLLYWKCSVIVIACVVMKKLYIQNDTS